MFEQILENVAEKTPLVHCITNYVTVGDVANVLLACGGSPIMADDESEVEDITTICNAIVINIGTLNSHTIRAMHRAGKRACALGHTAVLDPVGAGASGLRTRTAFELLDEIPFTVIRGNISEIKTIARGAGSTRGVDADPGDAVTEQTLDEAVRFIREAASKRSAVVAVTGAIDLVSDSTHTYIIRNGHKFMEKVSGTGCMLTAIIAAYCAANSGKELEATAAAVCAMGLCGEKAFARSGAMGTASLRAAIIDEISLLDAKALAEGAKVELR